MNNQSFSHTWSKAFATSAQKIQTTLAFNLKRHDHRKINLLLLNQITVEYFESQTAIRYLVNVKPGKTGDYFLEPFDQTLLKPIYQSLIQAKTNWQISIQPHTIRLALPFLTTAAKAKIGKTYRQFGEAAQIELRQLRQQFQQQIKNNLPAKDQQFQTLEALQNQFNRWKTTFQTIVDQAISDLLKV